LRLLYQSAWAGNLYFDWRRIARGWTCAMLTYAEYHGEWDSFRSDYQWRKLTSACA
jgi:hypothetical protein